MKTEAEPEADRLNFLAEPIGVSLAGFEEFDFEHTASWSHVELYAAAVGKDIDMNFLKAVLVISYYYPELHDALVEELRTSDALDGLVGTVEFVECVFKLWNEKSYYGVWREILDQLGRFNIWRTAEWEWTNDGKTARKYEMLAALDNKFPYLLVKFYAAHAKEIHAHDEMFMLWLRRRVEVRSAKDPMSARVLKAMDKDISRMNRTAMFMS